MRILDIGLRLAFLVGAILFGSGAKAAVPLIESRVEVLCRLADAGGCFATALFEGETQYDRLDFRDPATRFRLLCGFPVGWALNGCRCYGLSLPDTFCGKWRIDLKR